MKSVLSVKEASTFLQIDEKTLKSGLRSGTLNIGSAIVTKVTNNKPRYKYHIPIKTLVIFITEIITLKKLKNIWELVTMNF